jgi:RNA polymerase sigma-19 factor, ECF subfamily
VGVWKPHSIEKPDLVIGQWNLRLHSGVGRPEPPSPSCSMPSATDSDLVGEIRLGRESAFRDLFYRYHDALFRFAHRRLGDAASASDVVQDVFANVWEHRERLDPKKPVRAYLYRAAGNLVIDHYRHQAIREKHESEMTPQSTQPQAEFLFLEAGVKEAIDAMPPASREAFVLSRYDGLTYAEIARVLEISVKAVEKRMSMALRHLRKALAHFLIAVLAVAAAFLRGGW